MRNIEKKFIFIFLFASFFYINYLRSESNFVDVFGGWSICKELFNYILKVLPKGKTILELGSGLATAELAKFYKMYSIEHDINWIDKFNSTYIYAPIKNNWYDIEILKQKLPKQYDLILIDGPPGYIGRNKFYDNLNLFLTDNMIFIFDDTNRNEEYELVKLVAKKVNKSFELIQCKDGKSFGVIHNLVIEKT